MKTKKALNPETVLNPKQLLAQDDILSSAPSCQFLGFSAISEILLTQDSPNGNFSHPAQ